jgi:quinol monooxygenase YgiN
VQPGRAADGCIDVAITADAVDSRRIYNLEVWESADALDAWRGQANAPHTSVEPAEVQVRGFNAEDGGPLF